MIKKQTQNREFLMRRCFDLARLGAGNVSPNPLVGALLEYNGRIIGEGWHAKYGEAHAEVNALKSVADEDRVLIANSTLYVSLEPCCIYGKTPPCTSLVLKNKIPNVVISCLDRTPGVAGNGVRILREAGVEVTVGVLEEEGKALSQIRNTFVTKNRPYIILKWAESKDGFIGQEGKQIWLTHAITKRLVHKWRAEHSAIIVGTNTAITDNPGLNNRHYYGNSPLRIILDRMRRIPMDNQIYNGTVPTWIISEQPKPNGTRGLVDWKQLSFDTALLENIMKLLVEAKKSTLIVEGGSKLLNSFIAANLWDEARVLKAEVIMETGIAAPRLSSVTQELFRVGADKVVVYRK